MRLPTCLMVERPSIEELSVRLRESGETAARIAGKLPPILRDPRLASETIDELLLAINTRCAEIEDLRVSIDQSPADKGMLRVALQVENLWRDMARLVATTARKD